MKCPNSVFMKTEDLPLCWQSYGAFVSNANLDKKPPDNCVIQSGGCIGCYTEKHNSLKTDLVLTNRSDPDEMPLSVAFHQDLHCLQKWSAVVECWTRDRGFDLHRHHFVVSLSKTHVSLLSTAQPRKTRPDITEKLLTGT